MNGSPQEREVLALLRDNPMRTTEELARVMGRSDAEVRQLISGLSRRGLVRGVGWVLGERPPVVVVGAAVMDSKIRATSRLVLGTSNPGSATWTPGGVGRNIAENLARLGTPVELVAVIGDDPVGLELVTRTEASGVGLGNRIRSKLFTGVYVAVLADDGELVVAVSDLTATDSLTARMLAPHADLIGHAELLVIDANIPGPVCAWLLDFAAAAQVPVSFDPVSVIKGPVISDLLAPQRPVFLVTPTVEELGALLEREVGDDVQAIADASAQLHARGVANVWVRRGPRGSVLSSTAQGQAQQVRALEAPAARVQDVTGAGDAMHAAFLHGYLAHGDLVRAAEFGQAAAALTVEGPDSVRPDLTAAMVSARMGR